MLSLDPESASLLPPSATHVCLEALGPPEIFWFLCWNFSWAVIGVTTVVRFWAGCFAVIFNIGFVPVKLQVPPPSYGPDFAVQLFSIGETLGEFGAEPEVASWCFCPRPSLPTSLPINNIPCFPFCLSLEMVLCSYPRTGYMPLLMPWCHSSSYVWAFYPFIVALPRSVQTWD